jgi:DNA-binding IclR family transcriptional regulator
VVHSLLPGVGGFCAPVFDAQGHLALGLVVLGSVATLDTAWGSPPALALLRCARQLSADLGQPIPT